MRSARAVWLLAVVPFLAAAADGEKVGPPDLFTFASGALPLAFGVTGQATPIGFEQALDLIDGNTVKASVLTQAAPDAGAWFLYELPAPTTFTRLAVPEVHETPSAFQTFFREVVVAGSSVGPDAGFEVLGRATLSAHGKKGLETSLTLTPEQPAVRWVRVELSGGLDVREAKSTFHFSELVGEGTQAEAPRAEGFNGGYRLKNDSLDLQQDGPVVTGCFDGEGTLHGTVSGPMLRARGVATRTKVVSLWVLQRTVAGVLRGVRSTNGAPFRVVELSSATLGPKEKCPAPPAKKVSCGAVLHGVRFGYDTAKVLPDSEPLLERLAAGLRDDGSPKAIIEGHTSSEGAEQYNLELSRRRAEAVVAELVKRGLDAKQLTAVGRGEATPLASNADEVGRSLNRRVEVRCER
ncbi:MAG: OmpA family protein [Myxococcales bacterium]|nr:OmpA family protein [Myxococcales bacterium]